MVVDMGFQGVGWVISLLGRVHGGLLSGSIEAGRVQHPFFDTFPRTAVS